MIRFAVLVSSWLFAVLVASPAFAQIFNTNDDSAARVPNATPPMPISMGVNTGFGGQIGRDVSFVWDSDVLGNISLDVLGGACQGGGGADTAVIYIDAIPGRGFISTGDFTDVSDRYRAAVSGRGLMGATAVLTFASGIEVDYAIAFYNPSPLTVGGPAAYLYELVRGGPHRLVATLTATQSMLGCSALRIEGFTVNDLNLEPGGGFEWLATVINANNAFRGNEFQGSTFTGDNIGTHPFIMMDGDYNSFTTIGRVRINEVDADTPGVDREEFVELAGPPGTRLDGTVLTFFNGSTDTSYLAEDLDGLQLGPSGYAVLGAAMTPNVDRVLGSSIQNGADAVAFYLGDASNFPNGTPVTTVAGTLVDAVVYDTNDPDDMGLMGVLLLPGEPQVNEDAGGDKDRDSNSRCPDATGAYRTTSNFRPTQPSPGAENVCVVCGNGTVETGEDCDDGADNGSSRSCCLSDCTFRAAGEVCAAASGDCDADDTCNGSGTCVSRVQSAMTVCRAAAGPCDQAETCDGTSTTCPPDAFMAAGTVCRAAASSCDAPEECSGTEATCPTDVWLPDGTSCENGLVCDGAERCVAGVCMSGSPMVCDDGNVCTADACAEPGGCTHPVIPGCCNIDADCDDGDVCTADVCSGPGGTCSTSPITGCCVADADCDDGNTCTSDRCDAATNRCVRTPVAGCCTADTDCDDGNTCTSDSCDAATGTCTNMPVGGCCLTDGDCDDGNTCTMDRCVANACTNDAIAGCCVVDSDCDDSDPCTIDRCDGATGGCTAEPIIDCSADGGVGGADGGVGADAAMRDGGTMADATTDDAGGDTEDGGVSGGGCGCSAPGQSPAPGLLTVLLFGLALRRRRR